MPGSLTRTYVVSSWPTATSWIAIILPSTLIRRVRLDVDADRVGVRAVRPLDADRHAPRRRAHEVRLHDDVVLAVLVDHVEAGLADVREAREHLLAEFHALAGGRLLREGQGRHQRQHEASQRHIGFHRNPSWFLLTIHLGPLIGAAHDESLGCVAQKIERVAGHERHGRQRRCPRARAARSASTTSVDIDPVDVAAQARLDLDALARPSRPSARGSSRRDGRRCRRCRRCPAGPCPAMRPAPRLRCSSESDA